MKNPLRMNRFILLSVVLTGFFLRIYNLGARNLWYDELFSLRIITDLNIARLTQSALKPPLYFIILHFWSFYFGQSEFVLRFPSVLFGVFSIFLIYKAGTVFFDKKTGLTAAFLIALSPLHIWYAQEVRDYTVATFFVLLSVYLIYLIFKKNRSTLWTGFIVFSILSLYINYFAFFTLFVGSLIIVRKNFRFLLKRWVFSCSLICVAYVPWLFIFAKHVNTLNGGFWIPRPTLKSIIFTLENFNIGYNGTKFLYIASLIAFSSMFLNGIIKWREKKDELAVLLSFLIVPILVTFLISQVKPIYLDRQLMLFSPFYYLVVAAGMTRIKERLAKITIYISLVLLMLPVLRNYFSYNMPLPYSLHRYGVHAKKPLNEAADYINHHFRDQDAVFFSTVSILNMIYYIPNRDSVFFLIISRAEDYFYRIESQSKPLLHMPREDSRVELVTLKKEKENIPDVRKEFEKYQIKRAWLISSSWEREGDLSLASKVAVAWFNYNYSVLLSREFNGILIKLYAPKEETGGVPEF